ncbi:hypothetical protein [Streptomyces californicus]|uniref:hypothetical protein n=1 Tax=Streptomyces californicus TaxID=67351 RepID=UPI003403227D
MGACAAGGVPVRRGSGAGLREVVLCGWRWAVAAREVVLSGVVPGRAVPCEVAPRRVVLCGGARR